MNNMRVGLVVFGDIDYGLDLASLLRQAGLAVSLYTSLKSLVILTGSTDQAERSIRESELLPSGVNLRVFRFPRMRDPRSLFVIRRLCRAMREDRVDLAHILFGPAEIWVAVLANLLRAMPVVSTMIVPKPNVGDRVPAPVQLAISRLLAWGSDVIIVNGTDQVELVQRLYGVSPARTEYVPLGARSTAARWPGRQNPEEPGSILFYGKVQPRKGLEYLVRAQPLIARQVPQARIVIAGQGEDLDRCRQWIEDSAGFEIHEGFVSTGASKAFFERACVVALPYLSASTSGILATAYVFGKPVVATNVGCLPEYVEDGVTGLLVPPRDSERLAEALIRILQDDALRHSMGENGRRWVEAVQKQVVVETLRVYQKAISKHKEA